MQDTSAIIFKKKENRDRFISHIMKIVNNNEKEARYLIYEMATEFLYTNNINQILDQLKKRNIYWKHPNFDSIRNEFQEEDDFLENPPKVEEGVIECTKCHSKRTFSFSKQTRRSDESATVFIRCSNCNFMYKI